jgi:hypothetical protein
MQLELSTSPRTTWVWAHDIAEAERLSDILTAAGRSVSAATGRNAEPRILDLDIGVEAADGLATLMEAGYSFRWHRTQHELNRGPTLFGLAVMDTRLI